MRNFHLLPIAILFVGLAAVAYPQLTNAYYFYQYQYQAPYAYEYQYQTPTINVTSNSSVTSGLSITGSLAKGSGTFLIDDPIDPKNKLLYHSFVESPDVKNIYDGVATLDGNGEATIDLPDYFQALNKDFRYLGTPIGNPMPNLHLSQEVSRQWFGIAGHIQLKIAGGTANGRVSWQVTGIRHDPYIVANPITPEVWKSSDTPVAPGEYLFEGYAKPAAQTP